MSSITLTDVDKHFGASVAVDKVSLTVPQGQFLSLLGPSGCGKTTTLRMIAGFIAPSGGEILFDRNSVTRLPPYRRDIGMVFQSLALFPHMSVFDNIAYGLKLRRMAPAAVRARVDEMLELVRLGTLAERRPDALSGGQRQRVAFARALAINPKILLLDEPFAALDRKLREEMQVELRRLHEQLRITTVFVTHDQREAFTLSDQLAVMNQGRIEQLGPPRAIYYRPATRFIADFVGNANLLEVTIEDTGPDWASLKPRDEPINLRVPLEDGGKWRRGQHAALFVRPEFLTIVEPTEPTDGPVLDATVSLIRFVGELLEIRLRTAAGHHLVVTHQGAAAPRLSHDQRVRVRLAPEHTHLLA